MPRPFSSIRVALAAELVVGSGTCADLWRRTGCAWPLLQVRIALRNMVAAGEVANAPPVRVVGVRRPVPVYMRAAHGVGQGAPEVAIRDLIACWAAGSARLQQPAEAVM